MALLNPYLSFDHNCREAMNFYKDAIGGELTLTTVGESPAMAAQMPEHFKDSILHSTLKSGDMVIMGSDLSREKRMQGNAFQICINCKTEEELNTFFSKLSEGAKILQPIADMPWGAKYGELLDKYGNYWMFNLSI